MNATETAAYLKRNYDLDLVTIEGRFPAACALYWYCSDWHECQDSAKYSILSARLRYKPGAYENGPERESIDALIYADLEDGTLDAETLMEAIDIGTERDESHD